MKFYIFFSTCYLRVSYIVLHCGLKYCSIKIIFLSWFQYCFSLEFYASDNDILFCFILCLFACIAKVLTFKPRFVYMVSYKQYVVDLFLFNRRMNYFLFTGFLKIFMFIFIIDVFGFIFPIWIIFSICICFSVSAIYITVIF